MRVLLVEDEKRLAGLVADGLRKRGIAVDLAADGDQALEKAAVHGYDVVVLDRRLPGRSGDDVLTALRAGGTAWPVLMLTALGSVRDRVEGLGLGADDYLPKPFHLDELVARLHALDRRNADARPVVLERSGVRLDDGRREVTRDGRPVPLSAKELAVLRELLKADGRVLTAEELLESAWDEYADPFTNTVRVTVMRLRRKLGEPSPIVTLPGLGYRLP